MNIHTIAADATKALHRAESQKEVPNRALKALIKEQTALSAALHQQGKDVSALRHDIHQLTRHRGGFPWGLVLLAGGAYAAYRFIPAVQEQVSSLMGRVKPSVEGNLNRAGQAAKDAVQDATEGRNPSDAVQQAGGELRRAGEKSADVIRDRTQDLHEDVVRKAPRSEA